MTNSHPNQPNRYALTARGIVALAIDEARGCPDQPGRKPRQGWRLTERAYRVLDRNGSAVFFLPNE